jgi:four helix bundle protein
VSFRFDRAVSLNEVLDDALSAVEALRPIVVKIRARDKSLAAQITDAASSMVLNIGEAAYSDRGNQRARLSTASGSANEGRVGLRLAVAWGYAGGEDTCTADKRLDAVIAQLYRLLHPR